MSKITFRADDDLVKQLEALKLSKSEAMREALREYLTASSQSTGTRGADSSVAEHDATQAIDDLIRHRVDTLLTERPDTSEHARTETHTPDVNVTVTLEDERATTRVSGESSSTREDTSSDTTSHDADRRLLEDESTCECNQCGEHVDDEHVYCPNCGEKTSQRLFCECGDEIRSDWSFCPGCGRRTPAADVLTRETQP